MPRKLTREEFTEKATIKHNGKYTYEKVEYKDSITKVSITCRDHGDFEQNPGNHLSGQGCPECGKRSFNAKEEFKEKAIKVHDNKYTYEKVEYKNAKTPVTITCRDHGEFEQTPGHHLLGCGCQECGKISASNKKSFKAKEEFIEKANIKHNGKYTYEKVDYENSYTPVTITCLVQGHNYFVQTPNNHLSGRGCPKCGGSQKLRTEEFIERANKIHDNKYTYEKVVYENSKTPITISCLIPGHNPFDQTPDNHLSGRGCPKCGECQKLTTDEFIEKANIKHNDKYTYEKVVYIDTKTNVTITCRDHGEFEQTPNRHLLGHGCLECGGSQKLTTDEFIEKANIKHNGKYTYEKVVYKNAKTHITITCRDHGEFEQNPNHHLLGRGCLKCARTGYSKVCIEFLNTFPFDIKHAENGGEYIIKIEDKKYKADGYIKGLNSQEVDTIFNCHEWVNKWRNINSLEVIIEFHGCFWHGCPECYTEREEINDVNYKSYDELYKNTCKKREDIINNGYNYIEIWNCQYVKSKSSPI